LGDLGGPVLFVAPEPFYEDRGTPIAIRHVLYELSARGVEVDLLTFPVGADVEIPGLRILRVPNPFRYRAVPVGLSPRKIVLDLLIAREIPKLLRRRRYAYVHAVEESAFLAVLAARRRGIPVLYDMQSSLPEQLAREPLWQGPTEATLRVFERWLLRRVDVVACSAGLCRLVAENAPGTPCIEWIFPGHRAEPEPGEPERLRERLDIPAGAPVVLYCGTFEPYQGLSYVMDAAPEIRREIPETRILLVGGRPHQLRATGNGGEGIVRVPQQPRGRLSAFLSLADVLVSPRAYGNNFPLKIFDYLASGRPIVATDSPMHRAVLNETLALLVEPSPMGIARGVVALLRDPDRRAALGGAAKRYAEEALEWTAFSERVWSAHAAASRAMRGGHE
jgi:glycosyltransferase involved in cell wall biosynthesis